VDCVYECTEHFFYRFTDKRRADAVLDSVMFIITAVVFRATSIDCKLSRGGVLRCKAGGALGRQLSVNQENNFLFTISDYTLHREVSEFISACKFTIKERFFNGAMAARGPGQCDISHLLGLPWTSDQSVAETSTVNTQHSWKRHPTSVGIRTRNPIQQAAADPRLRARGHWDRLTI
jgi:hypothetical protein